MNPSFNQTMGLAGCKVRAESTPGRVLCLTVMLASLVAGSAGAQTARALTVQEAVERAFDHNPQVVQSVGTVRTTAAAERSAFGAYLPRLTATASSGVGSATRTDPAASGLYGAYSAGISASWDVFTGFRRGHAQEAARANSEVAGFALEADRAAIAFQVAQTFYEALRNRELETVSTARVQRAEEGLGAAERRLSVGSATRSDVLRAQLELNTARQAVLQAKTDYRSAAFALGRWVGFDGAAEPRADGAMDAELPVKSPEELQIDALLADAPLVGSAEAAAEAAQASVGVARAAYLPTVRLTTGVEVLNSQTGGGSLRSGWSVGLGLTYPLFDGFLRDEASERARVSQTVATARTQDTRRGIRAEGERALGQLRLSRDRVGLAQQAVSVAREDLRVQEDRYRLGVATMLDLLTSQTNLVVAENSLVSSRFDYQLARALLASLAGRTL